MLIFLITLAALRAARSPPEVQPTVWVPLRGLASTKAMHDVICDVTWREIQMKKYAVRPEGLDAAGVVGPDDPVRDRIGELPMRWWS